ncbi:MAG TPA: hypothetical protein VFP96_05890, partial [Candidatus Acidoferrum sp.]|nr:hypothetical protein [Candidatus Acidoferrum sp.]
APTGSLATAAKTLSSVASTLSKSSLSNTFGPLLDSVANGFVDSLRIAGNDASNRLATTFPSGPHTAAEKKLAQLFGQIASADGSANMVAATKLISQAAKTSLVVEKLVAKAEDVPPPPSHLQAKIIANGKASSYNALQVAVVPGAPGYFVINSGSGSGNIAIGLNNLSSGANDLDIAGGNLGIEVSRFLPLPPVAGAARNDTAGSSGSMHVIWDPVARTLVGTFSVIAIGNATIQVQNGSFSVAY